MSIAEFFWRFPNDEAAEEFFVEQIWPDGVRCPRCDGEDVYEPGGKAPLRFRCRPCRRFFSTRSSTVMRDSTLGYQTWLLALYLMTTNLKGVSSLKLHRDLGIRQKNAWHLAHRIRAAWREDGFPLAGIVEVDETYVGGKERNKHRKNRLPRNQLIWRGKGERGKAIVVGVKERETGEVRAEVVTGTKRRTLIPFVNKSVQAGSTLFTDSLGSYHDPWGYIHESVNHSRGEYVRGDIHVNGIESFWSMVKRGYKGTYHVMSKKHLHRYMAEFVGRQNARKHGTMIQLVLLARAMVGKRLRWKDLTGTA